MSGSSKLEKLFAELQPTPARWRRAVRVGLITALGAGLTGAMQISNPLGLTLLFNFALPEAAFSLARGAAFVAAAVVLQTLGLVVVGALVNSPIAHLTVFILLCLTTTYLIYGVSALGRLWVWVQVPVVTAFYLAMFMPNEMGWNAAQAFSGMAIATGWLLLCNALVRPAPVHAILSNSIAAALARTRGRLATLMAILCGDASADADRPVASLLGHHLSLLSPMIGSASSAAGAAALLADVIAAESFRGHVERLAAAVPAHGSGQPLPEAMRTELRALEAAVDRRLQHRLRRAGGANALAAP